MKRVLESGLVVTLTVITVLAMLTVKTPVMQEEQVFLEEAGDEEESLGGSEGTGYLFEDYDTDVNIPFEGQQDLKEIEKEDKSSMLEIEDFERVENSSRDRIKEYVSSSGMHRSASADNVTTDIRSESKGIISKIKNNISLEDKLSLIKIVSSLSLKDINDIKNAILNGTTNAESIKLWTMLRNKLPHEEYRRLENIITKYE